MARATTTCGTCGGTARYAESTATDGAAGWLHVTPPARAHRVDPDDSYVSGPADDEAGDPL